METLTETVGVVTHADMPAVDIGGLVAAQTAVSRTGSAEVAIVGAGPYGLSLAAHIKSTGRSFHQFGDTIGYWRNNMPKGMFLRSSWDASHIADPYGAYSLDVYQTAVGKTIHRPIPLGDFVEYAQWFQRQVSPEIDSRRITRISLSPEGFDLTLNDGAHFGAQRVFVATGLETFAWIPKPFDALPNELATHTSNLNNPADLNGRRVAIIGGGQSAIETAALVSEAGGSVDVYVREPQVRWLQRSQHLHTKSGLTRRLLYPKTDVGPPVLNQIVARPPVWQLFPKSLGARIAYRSIRPAAAGWLFDRVAGIRIHTNTSVNSVDATSTGLTLQLSDRTRREVDRVLLGTGYRIDCSRYAFLDQELRDRLATDRGYPSLGPGYESSIPGLHFVGASSAISYGPVMRFVSGTTFTARAVAIALGRQPG